MNMNSNSIATFVLAGALSVIGAAYAAEPVTSPYAKGGVISVVETDTYKRYVHTFTNTAEAATFRNKSSRTLHARILVVGAGGAGGYGLNVASGGGSGGGGGGVLERKGVDIASGDQWTIRVGKGATATTNAEMSKNETAGASSISNGVECVEVPGGGNGGESQDSSAITKGHAQTAGAAGGGGIRASSSGASGMYASSLLGVKQGPFPGGDAVYNHGYVGGGGGAGAAGKYQNGGEGLVSDITGVPLVYGSGGGGGGSLSSDGATVHAPGEGGTRAGKGASGTKEDSVYAFVKATAPEANSGGGGGGGLGGNSGTAKGDARYGTSGADGVVIVAYEIRKVPFVGGEVKKIAEQGTTATYIHVFTNANDVATLENVSGEDISVRMLVVGAGGAGGYGVSSYSGSGGGGGGGGVFDAENIAMPADGVWTIRVGKGATATTNTKTSKNETAGASSVSNGTKFVASVPGGGNGGESTKTGEITNGHAPTAGAAGGGGMRASRPGAEGSYPSSVLGVEHGKFSGGASGSYQGGGGGGAGAAGSSQNGGEGLASDITGVSLVYGSGGGSGGNCAKDGTSHYNYGQGGTRAGNGAEGKLVDSVPVTMLATAPEANSGCGGAGGLGGTLLSVEGVEANLRYGTSGADGIVVIRYDWTYDPNPPVPGLMLIVR